MTFSIVARDPANGDLGVAVASKFLAVGAVVPYALAGVGAIATQANANGAYGPDGLGLLAEGLSATATLTRLVGSDADGATRQAGIVDAAGIAATHTGDACLDWAGGLSAAGVAVQGNILTGAAVVEAMLDAFLAAAGSLPDRLLAALAAGDAAGGDSRGRQSAALVVVRAGGGYGGANDRWIDLRIDDHPTPITELIRLRALSALLNERPEVDDLIPIDEALAADLQARLAIIRGTSTATLRVPTQRTVRVGTARAAPETWTGEWDATLVTWMEVQNLEERIAAFGWIDPLVLGELRTASDAID